MSWLCVIAALALTCIQCWHDFAAEERRLSEMAKKAEAKRHG